MKIRLIDVGLTLCAFMLLAPFAAPFFKDDKFYLCFSPTLFALGCLAIFYFGYGFLFRSKNRSLSPKADRLYDMMRTVIHAEHAAFYGFLTGSTFASIIFLAAWAVKLKEEDFVWADNIPNAAAAFLAGLSTFYVINTFYRRLAPYTNMWELLAEIREDITRALGTGRPIKVFWIYAGFALGHYRSVNLDGSLNHNGREYKRFKGALEKLFVGDTVELTAISYSPEQLRAFFCSYEYQNTVTTLPQRLDLAVDRTNLAVTPSSVRWQEILSRPRIGVCVDAEVDLAKKCKNGWGSKALYFVRDPDDMPPNLIAIDDVIYHISSFGFPIFHQKDGVPLIAPYDEVGGFFEPNGKEKLIKLIAFRTQDRGLAEIVEAHIRHYIDLGCDRGILTRQQ